MSEEPNAKKGKKHQKLGLYPFSPSKFVYVFLLLLHIVNQFTVTQVARSTEVINAFGFVIPLSSITGVFSSLANIFIIFLTIFFGKTGFITSITLLSVQLPLLFRAFFIQKTPTSLSGIFGNFFAILAVVIIYRRNKRIKEYQDSEVKILTEKQEASRRLVEQTATALANAIDAKDTYSHGHSLRVAEYSKMIASELGKDEDEIQKIYFAALLHDVGKIGIPDGIITKDGKLTDEEYDKIKQHPVLSGQILKSISEHPYLYTGARYHHERYDGNGYPEGLKGEEIPENARIISVADAYDAMSSKRSYRDPLPQSKVRSEIEKNIGTQFDPEFAKIMLKLIDADSEYSMKEN